MVLSRLRTVAGRFKRSAVRALGSRALSPPEAGETVLFICREERHLWILDRLSGEGDVVVASDSTTVRRTAAGRDAVVDVVYFEEMQTLFDVAEAVMTARDRLNRWFSSLQTGTPAHRDVLFWRPYPEGGGTQRLLDATLLIDSVQSLLSDHDPDSVVLPQSLATRFDDRAIRATVRSAGVDLSTVNPPAAEAVRLVGGDPNAYFYGRHERLPIPRYALWVARAGQFLGAMISSRLRYALPGVGETLPSFWSDDHTVVVHHRGSGDKHRKDTTSVLPGFFDRPGFSPRVVTWRNEPGRSMVEKYGLSTVPLDGAAPLSSALSASADAVRLWRRAVARRNGLADESALTYRGIDMIPILWPEIRRFFRLYVPDRICLWEASRRYFADNSPAAMRYAGGGAHVPEGIVVRRAVERVSDPFTFTYRLNPFHVPYPYFRGFLPVNDRYFVAGQLERQRLENLGVPDARISEVGTSGVDEIREFLAAHSKEDSLRELGIDPGDLTVYFAPQAGRRGALTEREKRSVAEGLFRCANQHPTLSLMVKPHPNDTTSLLLSLEAEYRSENVSLIESSVSPFHCINAADVVITKSSLTGFEAFLMGTPVISVVLDDDRWFDQYGEAATRFRDVENLREFLGELVDDPDVRERWFDRSTARIEPFVERNLLVTDNPNERIADSVESAVRNRAPEADGQ